MLRSSTAIAALAVILHLQPASALDSNAIFPARLESAPVATASRSWRIEDVVEVTRIPAIALNAQHDNVAFLLEQPSLRLDATRYALYRLDLRKPGAVPVKLLESEYLADLQARPGSASWTVRGEFGKGVQLYEIDTNGKRTTLVESPDVGPVGGTDGLASSSHEGARPVGVMAYGWAADGKHLWYKTIRLPDAASRKSFRNGVRWDQTVHIQGDLYGPQAAEAFELRLFDSATRRTQLVAHGPGDRGRARCIFSTICANVGWADATHLFYFDGDDVMWSYDIATTRVRQMGKGEFGNVGTSPTAHGVLTTIWHDDATHHAEERGADGTVLRQLGEVDFLLLGGSQRAVYRDPARGSIHEARMPDRQGLIKLDSSGLHEIDGIKDDISNCDFDLDRDAAFCVHQSLSLAPEIVRLDLRDGSMQALARPNIRYDAIRPLQSSAASWPNKYGFTAPGYITLPRDYEPGKTYPAIVVTHARDAHNDFAELGFQWAFPIQLLAERGYVVLSVNEKFDRVGARAYGSPNPTVPPERVQRAMIENPVATMEAAVQDVVARGLVDPARVGIMGYSRGGEVTTAALSHSKVFRAGISGDDAFYAAGLYFSNHLHRTLYRALFGGSPYDPAAQAAYRAHSTSFRAAEFSGPLLQFFTSSPRGQGNELDTALRDAGIPTELYFFHGETHVPHRPGVRQAIGGWTIDWLDYWLLDKRDPSPAKAEQYKRWDEMRVKWQAVKS